MAVQAQAAQVTNGDYSPHTCLGKFISFPIFFLAYKSHVNSIFYS